MTISRNLRILAYLLIGILFTLNILGPVTIPTEASVGILPQGTDIRNEEDKGWFIYKVAPGAIREDKVVLTNNSNEEIVVDLKGRDSEITSDGAFTVISNELQNKAAGRWIRLDAEKYSIPPAQSIEVPFTIQVPLDAAPGEYGAGLAVQQIGDESGSKTGNVLIKTRNAVRMYIAVEGDLSLDGNVGSLNIIDPKDENFAIEKSKRSSLGRDNMIVQFQAQNTGNIFGVLNASYTVNFSDGEELTGTLKRDLTPGIPIKDYYIETRKPYLAGETKVSFEYTIEPLNVTEGFNASSLSGNLEDVLNLTQEEVDAFAPARSPIEVSSTSNSGTKGAVTEEPTPDKVEEDNGIERKLLITAIVFLVIILLLQIVNFARPNNNSKKK